MWHALLTAHYEGTISSRQQDRSRQCGRLSHVIVKETSEILGYGEERFINHQRQFVNHIVVYQTLLIRLPKALPTEMPDAFRVCKREELRSQKLCRKVRVPSEEWQKMRYLQVAALNDRYLPRPSTYPEAVRPRRSMHCRLLCVHRTRAQSERPAEEIV